MENQKISEKQREVIFQRLATIAKNAGFEYVSYTEFGFRAETDGNTNACILHFRIEESFGEWKSEISFSSGRGNEHEIRVFQAKLNAALTMQSIWDFHTAVQQ